MIDLKREDSVPFWPFQSIHEFRIQSLSESVGRFFSGLGLKKQSYRDRRNNILTEGYRD